MLDRFGLSVEVLTPDTIKDRIEVVRRRDAFENDPDAFIANWADEDKQVCDRIEAARGRCADIAVSDEVLETAARICMALGTDGLRGELTLMRAARALAALEARSVVTTQDLSRIAASALRHRLRRNPLDEAGSTVRVERALAEVMK